MRYPDDGEGAGGKDLADEREHQTPPLRAPPVSFNPTPLPSLNPTPSTPAVSLLVGPQSFRTHGPFPPPVLVPGADAAQTHAWWTRAHLCRHEVRACRPTVLACRPRVLAWRPRVLACWPRVLAWWRGSVSRAEGQGELLAYDVCGCKEYGVGI